jgi:hypothetical protein
VDDPDRARHHRRAELAQANGLKQNVVPLHDECVCSKNVRAHTKQPEERETHEAAAFHFWLLMLTFLKQSNSRRAFLDLARREPAHTGWFRHSTVSARLLGEEDPVVLTSNLREVVGARRRIRKEPESVVVAVTSMVAEPSK